MIKDNDTILENLRIQIWKSAAVIEDENELIQDLLNKAGRVLGSENISFMPCIKDSKEVIVELIWRKDGTNVGIGDRIPSLVVKHLVNKPYVYFSFDNIPRILKPVLLPFQKKYGTKSTLVIPFGDPKNPDGFISSQTYTYNKIYSDSEINVFIEISNIINLKLKQLRDKKALIESEERFKQFTQFTTEGIIIHKNSIIVDVNPSVTTLSGYEKEEILNKSVFIFIHPDYHEYVKAKIAENALDPYEIKILKKDGTIIFTEVSIKEGFYKNEKVRIVSVNDITHRKATEEMIRKLSATVEQSPISILMTDIKGIIEYVNPQMEKITGYSKSELLGKTPKILSTGHSTKEEIKNLWDTILSGYVWHGEFLNRRKDGSTYWEEAIIAPVNDEKGKAVSFIGLKTDISKKKEADRKLRAFQEDLKEAVLARDKLFAIISHDLRSPFNSILGFSEIMVEKSKEGDYSEFEELTKYMYKSSKHVFDLLDNLLQWSRIKTGRLEFNPKSIDLRELTNDVINVLTLTAEEKEIRVNVKGENKLIINADQFMIETVIRNLISNALKFTPIGGEITIEFHSKDDSASYSVTDNGVGITKDSMTKLFKPEEAYSTKGTAQEKGTGLGLILCKEFIEYHKGKILVESKFGKGSTFTFIIPQET